MPLLSVVAHGKDFMLRVRLFSIFWSILIAHQPFWSPFWSFWSISNYFDQFNLFQSVWSFFDLFRSISILALKSPKYFNHMPAILICFDTRSKLPKLSQSGILHAIHMVVCVPAICDSRTFLLDKPFVRHPWHQTCAYIRDVMSSLPKFILCQVLTFLCFHSRLKI